MPIQFSELCMILWDLEQHLGYFVCIEVYIRTVVFSQHTNSLSSLLKTTEKNINTCANLRIGQCFLNTLYKCDEREMRAREISYFDTTHYNEKWKKIFVENNISKSQNDKKNIQKLQCFCPGLAAISNYLTHVMGKFKQRLIFQFKCSDRSLEV